jgi:hypothetical protein
MQLPSVPGYQIERSIEPPHPRCTTSDVAYAATNSTGDRVVLKILSLYFPLRPESSTSYLEAMAKAREISSHRVVRVLDAGFANDGAPYYAMQFVEGETIASVIDRKLIATAEQTRQIIRQLATAAEAAEEAGCAPTFQTRHVMLSPGGARAWNFGLSPWRTRARELVAGQYTAPGHMVWHPNMTPHEAKGLPPKPSTIGAQLALIAFSMLTARHYWNADNDPDAAPMAMLMEVMAGVGAPPSTRTQVALPDGFDVWFMQCLAGELEASEAAASFPS